MGIKRKSKQNEKYRIRFTTMQKQDSVTGSMHTVECCGLKLVLDMGLYQDNSMNIIDKYRLNAHNLRYEYSDVDYVLLGHLHSDI